MPRTVILKPLEERYHDEKETKLMKENSETIKQVLDGMKYGEDMSFEDFLKKLGLTEESYILAIRDTLKRDILFLQRSPSEIRINNYNTYSKPDKQTWKYNMC